MNENRCRLSEPMMSLLHFWIVSGRVYAHTTHDDLMYCVGVKAPMAHKFITFIFSMYFVSEKTNNKYMFKKEIILEM